MDRAREIIDRAQQGSSLSSVYQARRAAASRRGGRPPGAVSGRGGLPALSIEERLAVIDTFAELIEGLYTHLPLKRARYAVDPLQRLRLLRQRVEWLDEWELHQQLAATVTGLRDAHTRYIGPTSLEGRVAMLPFLVESFGAPPRPRYLVSKVGRPSLIGDRRFRPGVELRWWNAVPMDRAVDLYAEHETGGRPDSRRSRALETLTFRALQYQAPPDEHWVDVGYVDLDGKEREVRVDWRVVRPGRARTAGTNRARAQRLYAIDHASEMNRRVKKLLFVPDLWFADHGSTRPAGPTARSSPRAGGGWLPTRFQDNVAAKAVDTPSGRFGYLRLWSFDLVDDRRYVDEVIRLLAQLPDRGLIIDLRANPGGLIWAAERLLQLFTPHPVGTTKFSMLATPLTRAMADATQNEQEMAPWRDSLHEAVSSGELYSRSAPITPPEVANDIGQVYPGPVVAVVDANTYSAGDLFAAGFVDNRVGPLVSVGEATGAGGANVWEHTDVESALVATEFARPPLPAGISYTLAVRRATRSGPFDGLAIEDVGVAGDLSYAMTRRDLIEDNRDLLAFCGRLLRRLPRTSLTVQRRGGRPARLEVSGTGLDRVRVLIDGRLHRDDGDVGSDVRLPADWQQVEIEGFADGELRQRRLLRRQ